MPPRVPAVKRRIVDLSIQGLSQRIICRLVRRYSALFTQKVFASARCTVSRQGLGPLVLIDGNVKFLLDELAIRTLELPPVVAGLNPIENVWGLSNAKWWCGTSGTSGALSEVVAALYESMPRREGASDCRRRGPSTAYGVALRDSLCKPVLGAGCLPEVGVFFANLRSDKMQDRIEDGSVTEIGGAVSGSVYGEQYGGWRMPLTVAAGFSSLNAALEYEHRPD
ncbi:hypothetical protein HPB50_027890 [Hyalomma asiaticum]|nr:hypothetical protein HPB50_027890 [Hyalomma asiaticum]